MSTSWVVDDLVDDAAELLDGRVEDLVAVLEEIASLGDVEAPTPSAELALLLAGRPAGTRRPARRTASGKWVPARGHRRLAPVLGGLAAAAVAGVTLTGTAAYANELPPSVQRVVAHLSEDYLPFTFPRPAGDPPTPAPAPARPQGAGARSSSSGAATPRNEPSAVAQSGVVPASPSAVGPTDRADARLLRRDVRKPEVPVPSAATPSAVRDPSGGPYDATTVQGGADAPAMVLAPVSPSAPAPSLDPVTPSAAPSVVDPQTAPSGAASAPTSADPGPSAAPSTDPSAGSATDPATGSSSAPASGPTSGSASGPASDPSVPQTTPPPSSSQSAPPPSTGRSPSTGPDATDGSTPSRPDGTDAATGPSPTLMSPGTPGTPTDGDEGGPDGLVSPSPDALTGSPAVGSGSGPAGDVVADPGTAGSAAPTTP